MDECCDGKVMVTNTNIDKCFRKYDKVVAGKIIGDITIFSLWGPDPPAYKTIIDICKACQDKVEYRHKQKIRLTKQAYLQVQHQKLIKTAANLG